LRAERAEEKVAERKNPKNELFLNISENLRISSSKTVPISVLETASGCRSMPENFSATR
jgi:hypothetical protein